jgi:hypothetical protein
MSSDGSAPDRGPLVLVVTTTTLVIASVFVFARLVSRIGIVKHMSLDDYFIILAWVSIPQKWVSTLLFHANDAQKIIAFGLSFAIDYGDSKGLGRHDVDIPPDWFPSLRRAEYAFAVLYVCENQSNTINKY